MILEKKATLIGRNDCRCGALRLAKIFVISTIQLCIGSNLLLISAHICVISSVLDQCKQCKIRARMVERVVTSKEGISAIVPHSGQERIVIKVQLSNRF